MKKNVKITFCGIIAALSVVFMLLSYFPYLTYAVPAVSGFLIMIIVMEIGVKWAFGAYVAAAVLIFLLAEPESKLMYVCLFGYYPIIKALVERINKPVFEWILKLAVFNAAVCVIYLVFAGAFGISLDDFGTFGKYGAYIFLAAGNFVFVIYDIALSQMSGVYAYRIHPKIKKYLK